MGTEISAADRGLVHPPDVERRVTTGDVQHVSGQTSQNGQRYCLKSDIACQRVFLVLMLTKAKNIGAIDLAEDPFLKPSRNINI
jgi:hypothetical protein